MLAGQNFYLAHRTFADVTLCEDCYAENGVNGADRLLFYAGDALEGDCPVCLECSTPACHDGVCGACGFASGCAAHDEGHHPTCSDIPAA
jgi:hypothetical protein